MSKRQQQKLNGEISYFPGKLMRPLGFVMVLGIYLPISIVPLYMEKISNSFFGMTHDFYLSLPVSVDMGAILLSSLILNVKAHKLRWKSVLCYGMGLLIIAMVGSVLAPNGLVFLACRIFYGLGYGCFVLGAQLYVVQNTNTTDRGAAMSSMLSGFFAGSLCGCATGGIIADKFSYQAVFLVSAIILVLVLALLYVVIKGYQDPVVEAQKAKAKLTFKLFFSYLSHKEIWSLLFFLVLPYGAIAVGVFNYLLPVNLKANGFSASVVGQLNIFYALLVILLSPVFGKVIDKSKHKYLVLAIGLLFSAGATFSFAISSPLVAALIAMLCLGMSAAINEGGQPTVIADYQSSKKLSSEQSIMVLDLFVRMGQIVGPLLISTLIVAFNKNAFIILGSGALVLTLLLLTVQTLGRKDE